ncbi:6-carboxytetrahydropterin synthase [Methylococcus sp. EFPC2]|uniref:6-pyruvoyl trahydropterin synthase family protein n=1 Tax=Methylococcus sp. EFPC2 TaxID=2812648 RepID=UPI0019685859|nr:6-carboxytetrahydropterin synthase [Methylococcus sp. EFPC2]QSA95642.1 6-carboxytetrahydropterin synthase [Methylococcus sp. EFPC2]
MYTITKEIYFCYGHRLMNHPGKCRHLHGHSVKAAITVQAEQLNDQGMVCDFADLATCAHEFIDGQIDHNLLIHENDPLLPALEAARERYMALTEHPTAEYLARLIYEFVKEKGFEVLSVTLWETASACATYSEA